MDGWMDRYIYPSEILCLPAGPHLHKDLQQITGSVWSPFMLQTLHHHPHPKEIQNYRTKWLEACGSNICGHEVIWKTGAGPPEGHHWILFSLPTEQTGLWTMQSTFEWMNEWCIYIALFVYCCTPKRFTIMWGGLSSTTTSVQHPLGWCDGCHRTTASVRSPHTSYRWRGERVIEPIKWMGIIRRPWLTRASGGNLGRTPGLHPTLYEKCHGIFNDHRESGPRFNVSSERWCLLTV